MLRDRFEITTSGSPRSLLPLWPSYAVKPCQIENGTMCLLDTPAIAVTDLPPWAVAVVKRSSRMISKVDVPCREYFASRSACSL